MAMPVGDRTHREVADPDTVVDSMCLLDLAGLCSLESEYLKGTAADTAWMRWHKPPWWSILECSSRFFWGSSGFPLESGDRMMWLVSERAHNFANHVLIQVWSRTLYEQSSGLGEGGAYGQALGGGVGVASKKFMLTGKSGSRRKKDKPKEKDAFDGFQKAEKQRKVMLDLRRNFEADKARVEKLKESRRFKPY
ncbi:uncharacterized protein EDB91DRAFT_1251398 [Suillus paluster]|uniref:uncharacterized protein n=1 Tax=Suillus paluster TaxID=48578 RepID=UPI001B85E099|nr:uncharacterized protein EDB91DRAFT_1251398 [Suillus paluster]KAG1733394.1 hypothetical protein EDB91DRAFT_1251398 [Suillus paluster]